MFAPSPYTARVTILATPTPTTDAVTNNDIQTAQAYLPTLAELATIRQILDQVIAKTGAPTTADLLAENVSTHVPVATNLLEIGVSDPDPAMAAALANAIAAELSSYVPPGSTTGTVHLDLTVVDPATPPTSRDGPGLALRIALGAAIALFLTVTIAFLIENLRQVRNTEDPTPTPHPTPPGQPSRRTTGCRPRSSEAGSRRMHCRPLR